jgi:predicted CoA-binding protein
MSETVQIPTVNLSEDEIHALLKEARTIAVVGLSDNPERESHHVAEYMMKQGYKIIPVNPVYPEVLRQVSYPSLSAIPKEEVIDIVDVFRRPEEVPAIVEEAIAVGARALWLQAGIVHNGAAQKAAAAGLKVVQNLCLYMAHRRFFGK